MMDPDAKAAMHISFGCLGLGFLLFAASVFVIAAAIKWVAA